jgi:hypothetical protein
MREMPVAPDRLWQPQKETQINGKPRICRATSEEREVDEVVRDGVRDPPETERDQRRRRYGEDSRTVHTGETDKRRVTRRMPEESNP